MAADLLPRRSLNRAEVAAEGLAMTSLLHPGADSLGAAARFGRGDVQRLTAGKGVVHSEMFPLLRPDRPNPLELFQIWLNLPAADKLVDAYFTMFWDSDIPKHVATDEAGRSAEVTVIAGALEGVTPPPPPPHSWAARADTDVAI